MVEEKVTLEVIVEKKEENKVKVEEKTPKVEEKTEELEEKVEVVETKPLTRANFPLVVKTSGPRAKKEEKSEPE